MQSFVNSSKLEEHNGIVQTVSFNDTGDLLCSGANDLKIAIWDWKEDNLSHIFNSGESHSRMYICHSVHLFTLVGHALKIRQCKWTSDNRIVTCK